MIVGCYSLHLYCDTPQCPHRPHRGPDFDAIGETGGEARDEARKAGWKIDMRQNKAYCPKCASADRKEK